MTKSLTEQFMDGSFKCNVYYCQTKYDGLKLLLLYHDGCEHGYAQRFGECEDYPHKDILEVLAPVPSYEEYQRLLSIALKPKNPLSDVMMCYDTEREKEVVEKLEQQLAEANEVIKWYAQPDRGCAKDYLKKWGVK